MKDILTTKGSASVAVGSASAQLTADLVAGKTYRFSTTTDTWVKQGFGAQTAAAVTADNALVPAGATAFLHGSNGESVSVIRATADGSCSISLLGQG